jgi:hypothetical protein
MMKNDFRPRISNDYEQDAALYMFKIKVYNNRETLVFVLPPKKMNT